MIHNSLVLNFDVKTSNSLQEGVSLMECSCNFGDFEELISSHAFSNSHYMIE